MKPEQVKAVIDATFKVLEDQLSSHPFEVYFLRMVNERVDGAFVQQVQAKALESDSSEAQALRREDPLDEARQRAATQRGRQADREDAARKQRSLTDSASPDKDPGATNPALAPLSGPAHDAQVAGRGEPASGRIAEAHDAQHAEEAKHGLAAAQADVRTAQDKEDAKLADKKAKDDARKAKQQGGK